MEMSWRFQRDFGRYITVSAEDDYAEKIGFTQLEVYHLDLLQHIFI